MNDRVTGVRIERDRFNELAYQLVVDMVVEGKGFQTTQRFGLEWQHLEKLNRDIVALRTEDDRMIDR